MKTDPRSCECNYMQLCKEALFFNLKSKNHVTKTISETKNNWPQIQIVGVLGTTVSVFFGEEYKKCLPVY